MRLGFVSAIFPEWSLEMVCRFAVESGFSCVELMCWPPGKAERRYAGVTHLDVAAIGPADINRVHDLLAKTGLTISSLGYYPNVLSSDEDESQRTLAHLYKVIDASVALGVFTVTTFVGRDPMRSVDENWPKFLEVWRPLIQYAEERGVRVGIENCPMLFTADEWPGGKNLATTPAIWRRMFEDIPNPNFGLNYDPSHMIWQMMDYIAPLYEFQDRLVHIHAKDARVDRSALDRHGIMGYPKLWHTPKVPGMGEVDWGRFFGALTDTGYDGPVAIEVEDRAFEGSLAKRQEALVLSRRHLLPYVAG